MKIALIGYGKMGKEIEQIAISRGHEIVLIIDENTTNLFTSENLKKADVAIEFTRPEFAFENVQKCFDAYTPVVCGTTGWAKQYEVAKEICQKNNNTLFWSSNFSLGVNIFMQINKTLAKLMNPFSQYEPEMEEIHHTAKLDAPSGTAITLAEGIIENLERKTSWVKESASAPSELAIRSVRTENVPGTHIIKYDSEVDYIEITHCAKGRKGFALGAVLAAEFIKDKKGIYSMKDMLF